jgi:hypothetical protein
MSRLSVAGDLLPLAAGIGLLGGSAWLLLLDGRDASRGSAPTPEQVATNIRPVGRVHVAAAAPAPSPTSTPASRALSAEPTQERPTPDADAAAAPIATASAPSPAKPPIPAVKPPTPDHSTRTATKTTAPAADAPTRATAPAEAAKDRETPPEASRPPAPVTAPVPSAPPSATAEAFELVPDAEGWHGTYRQTTEGITLFPHRVRAADPGTAALEGREGMLRTTPEGNLYFELAPPAPDATGTAPPTWSR